MPSHLDNATDVDFIIKTALERDPKKRRVKPVETQASILDFDLGESSDDSDFRIEDHPEISDDSLDSNGEEEGESSSVDDEEDSESSDLDELKHLKLPSDGMSIADVIQQATTQSDKNLKFSDKDAQILVCCGCLGDQSDGVNEIVECDSCGVTVHEACYGVSDSASIASTDSLSPTAPWFCEACKAGVMNPVCELCPNSGGIFKETDVGKWVHLVCALYVPGVAFGEVDKLTSVTLFEMPYNKWGAKTCSLCQDERFARTGVCIGCDAGMCRTYFHVTCAQREGYLSEAHSEEVDQADPFYAHCKLHSDKTLVRRRKRNYMALQLRTHFRRLQFEQAGHSDTPEQLRIQRKLEKQRIHYFSHKKLKTPPWVPTQKMPRLLTTSASACRKLMRKAELMGIQTTALEMQEAQAAALVDVRKKWHIPPAFTVEFIAYYLDRNDRLKVMKETLEKLLENNRVLLEEQQALRVKYDELLKRKADETREGLNLQQTIHKYHSAILSACPTKNLPNIEDLGKPPVARAHQPMMVPTAAALKMGVGFPLNNVPAGRSDRVLSSHARQVDTLLNECGICRQRRDQHLLAKCDTCHLYYHLNCLNPPLTRLPKKSKLYGWQCSECDKTSDSEVEQVQKPRRSRSRYSREGKSDQEIFTPKVKIKPVEPNPPTSTHVTVHVKNYPSPNQSAANDTSFNHSDANGSMEVSNNAEENSVYKLDRSVEGQTVIISRSGKKRRREKHRSRYSPDLGFSREHKRKRKKKSLDIENPNPHPRITIKIKPIPMPAGEVASTSNPQRFYVPNENNDNIPPLRTMAATIKTSPIVRTTIKTSPAIMKSPSPSVSTKSSTRSFSSSPKKNANPLMTTCDVCNEDGNKTNMVSCDECQKCYHFACLDPPLKKSPKMRGYSWHCADCDPTASE